MSCSIKAEAASVLINLDQARVLGLFGLESASKFCAPVEAGSASIGSASCESWSVFWSSGDSLGTKCFRRLTLKVLCLLLLNLILATDSLSSTIVAGPSHFGANFRLTLRKSVWEYQTCCPIEKSWGCAFLSCCALYLTWLSSIWCLAISLAFCRICNLSDAKDSP